MIFDKLCLEFLNFTEKTVKNLNTAPISEAIVIAEIPKTQHKFLSISESFLLVSKARSGGNVLHIGISESLSFQQTPIPRIINTEAAEIITFSESSNDRNFVDKLIFNESLIFNQGNVIPEIVTFGELLGLHLTRNIIRAEPFVLTENITVLRLQVFSTDVLDPLNKECHMLVIQNGIKFGAPTVNDDMMAGYDQFSEIIDTSHFPYYIWQCVDPTIGAAVWVRIAPSTGGGGGTTMFEEIPSGVINGTNKVFTLSNSPTVLLLFLNGVAQTEGADYTISLQTITFVTAPHPGDTLLAAYTY